jgi:hypothetical protein
VAAARRGSSPREAEKQEGMTGSLTEVFTGRLDDAVRPTAVESERRL